MNYFTKTELALWTGSTAVITAAFFLFGMSGVISLVASLIGVTAIIFGAKGNPLGQLLMIVFSCIYGYISYGFCYYGEMLTYLGMTAPMAVLSLVSWFRNPFKGSHAEVEVAKTDRRDIHIMLILGGAVTVIFYFVLRLFGTANLIPSTVSVATSFCAAFLTFRRSAFFSLAYAANDAVLIVMWVLASLSDRSYVSVAVCFCVFLINDIYAFLSWRKMEIRQSRTKQPTS